MLCPVVLNQLRRSSIRKIGDSVRRKDASFGVQGGDCDAASPASDARLWSASFSEEAFGGCEILSLSSSLSMARNFDVCSELESDAAFGGLAFDGRGCGGFAGRRGSGERAVKLQTLQVSLCIHGEVEKCIPNPSERTASRGYLGACRFGRSEAACLSPGARFVAGADSALARAEGRKIRDEVKNLKVEHIALPFQRST